MSFIIKNCPKCLSKRISKVVDQNNLCIQCRDCRASFIDRELSKLQKKVFYLDQNFYSNAYKKEPRIISLYSRLEELAKKQLVVCPYSETHIKETSCFDDRNNNLWPYIAKLSCGKNFKSFRSIEEEQIINSLVFFLEGGLRNEIILRTENSIGNGDINDWCYPLLCKNYIYKNVVENFTIPKNVREEKDKFLTLLTGTVQNIWSKNQFPFEQDYLIEVRDHVKRGFNIIVGFFCFLQERFPDTIQEGIRNFFKVDIFSKVPIINVRSCLWALIKQNIRAQPPGEKTLQKYRSTSYDIDPMSALSSYCDAVFVEKQMAHYLTIVKRKNPEYKFKVFSFNNLKSFEHYLDEIEKSLPKDINEDLRFIRDNLDEPV